MRSGDARLIRQKRATTLCARAESALRPKVLGGFFRKYNKAKFPPDNIAQNVLVQEFGVPADRAAAALQIIKDNGQYVGFIRDTKTGPFVAIEDPQPGPSGCKKREQSDELDESARDEFARSVVPSEAPVEASSPNTTPRH
jgi:hypothetical protein